MSYILDLLYFGNDAPERQTSQPIYMRVPFLESCFKVIPSGQRPQYKSSLNELMYFHDFVHFIFDTHFEF